uniref:Uncharacterized protein n=1 Tax=Arundo donax TaxID=35708 RepID=A0A0A9HAH1_ARUDO
MQAQDPQPFQLLTTCKHSSSYSKMSLKKYKYISPDWNELYNTNNSLHEKICIWTKTTCN